MRPPQTESKKAFALQYLTHYATLPSRAFGHGSMANCWDGKQEVEDAKVQVCRLNLSLFCRCNLQSLTPVMIETLWDPIYLHTQKCIYEYFYMVIFKKISLIFINFLEVGWYILKIIINIFLKICWVFYYYFFAASLYTQGSRERWKLNRNCRPNGRDHLTLSMCRDGCLGKSSIVSIGASISSVDIFNFIDTFNLLKGKKYSIT